MSEIEIARGGQRFYEAWAVACGVPGRRDDSEIMSERARLPDWGFFHLSIPEAAGLIAMDMWVAGDIPGIEEPEGFDGDIADPQLVSQLNGHVEYLEQRLTQSVVTGFLTPDLTIRNLNDDIVPERTYILFSAVSKWLEERQGVCGEVMDDWMEDQIDRAGALLNEANFYRTATTEEIRVVRKSHFAAEYSVETQTDTLGPELKDAYKAATIEIKRLRKALLAKPGEQPSKVDRPVTTRQRRTLLTIIAALCNYSDFKPNERGAAGKIAAMTEEIAAPITAETIAGLLKEMPEALETRVK